MAPYPLLKEEFSSNHLPCVITGPAGRTYIHVHLSGGLSECASFGTLDVLIMLYVCPRLNLKRFLLYLVCASAHIGITPFCNIPAVAV